MSRIPIVWLVAALLLAAPRAGAHLVHGTVTLSSLVAQADVVARVRIVQAQGLRVLGGPGSGRPLVRAELLETLKGAELVAGAAELRFATHGHGAVEYADGEEVVLCLRAIEKSRELDELAGSGVRFASAQEHDEKLALGSADGPQLLHAVRAYAALGRGPSPQPAAFQKLTLELLDSPVSRISLGALRDLVLLGDAFPLAPADVARLERRIAQPDAPVALRAGLLAELERRGAIDAPPRWATLVRDTRGESRRAAIQAASAHPSEPVRAALAEVATGENTTEAVAALVALGWAGNDAGVPVLEKALLGADPQRAGAAVRGLAGVGTSAARAALERGAKTSPDLAARRAATAALRRLDAAR